MKNYQNTIPLCELKEFTRFFLTQDMLLFDIETTGLSASDHFIYCIGCSWLSDDKIQIQLLFADDQADEPAVLEQFSALTASHPTVISFNGTTFDIPFVRKRCARYDMPDPFCHTDSFDLYREIRHLKKLLCLKSYRQKSLEQFLGCFREDRFNGKELIDIYLQYTASYDPEKLKLLLMHNYEDVKGMYDLLEILSYRHFLEGFFHIKYIFFEKDGENLFLNFSLIPDIAFPQSICILNEQIKILFHPKSALIRLPVFYGTLRHYFSDYKNYYYLPDEHTVIHKSIGSYVDADHRCKATRENCFVEKECFYLMIPTRTKDSYLKKDLSDKCTYLDLSELIHEPIHEYTSISENDYPCFYEFLLQILQITL